MNAVLLSRPTNFCAKTKETSAYQLLRAHLRIIYFTLYTGWPKKVSTTISKNRMSVHFVSLRGCGAKINILNDIIPKKLSPVTCDDRLTQTPRSLLNLLLHSIDQSYNPFRHANENSGNVHSTQEQ